jgi:hypothetical protein
MHRSGAGEARKKAVGATRHDILVAYYHVVADRVAFRELGPDWFVRRFSPERRTTRLVRQLEALGHRVLLERQPESTRGDSHHSRGLVRSGDRQDPARIFEFVSAHQAEHRVATQCRVLEVSTSG